MQYSVTSEESVQQGTAGADVACRRQFSGRDGWVMQLSHGQ